MTITKADDIQHGGTHYVGEYQHWNLVADLSLDYYIACATKYVTRHKKKNGREDVEKAGHYMQKKLDLIAEGRIAAPYELPLQYQFAKAELLNRFADANDIDPESLEFKFLELACLATDTINYVEALAYAKALLEHYPPPLAAAAKADPVKFGAPIRSDVAALIDRDNFTVEGWRGATTVYWKCKRCNLFFAGQEGQLPSQVHTECVAVRSEAAEPTRAYVDQGREHGNYGGGLAR